MDRTDASFPDVVDAVRQLPGEFLLDGEIVPWCDGCVLPFAHIQKRLGRKVLTPKIIRDNPAAFVAFDILYKDGELLMDQPLRERRAALEALIGGDHPPSPGTPGEGRGEGTSEGEPRIRLRRPLTLTLSRSTGRGDQIGVAHAAARRSHHRRRDRRRLRRRAATGANEGIILKDPASPYSPGRRGQMWFKLKTHLPTLDCVVTAAEYGHGKRRNVLSDYTFAVWDREPTEPGATLVNVGKAYSGVTDEEIAQLTELFLKISQANFGRVHAVEPKVVLEIAFDQIQTSNAPRERLRVPLPAHQAHPLGQAPEDADRLSRVIEVYQLHHQLRPPHAPGRARARAQSRRCGTDSNRPPRR